MLAWRLILITSLLGLFAVANASELPSDSELARHGLKISWWGRAAIDPSREQVDFVINDEEVVFVRSTTGIITAFDAESGRKMWSILVGRPDQQGFAPTSNAKQLLIAVGLRLISINKKNGDVLWNLELPKHPSAAPAIDDDRVYVGMVDGRVYAFDLRTIQKLHEDRMLPAFSHIAEVWRYQAPSEIVSPPITSTGAVCFASSSGSLYSVDAEKHKLKFQFESDGRIITPLGLGKNPESAPGNNKKPERSILLAAENSQMYCLNQENGEYRWTFTSAHAIRQQPRVFGNRCYVTPETVGTYALSMSSGIQLWREPQEQARKILMVSQDRLYAFNGQKEIVVVDTADGKLVSKMPYRKYIMTPTNDRTDRMFLTTQDGLVVCLKERSSTIPTYHLYPEKRPILPEITPEEGTEPTSDSASPSADASSQAGQDAADNAPQAAQ